MCSSQSIILFPQNVTIVVQASIETTLTKSNAAFFATINVIMNVVVQSSIMYFYTVV